MNKVKEQLIKDAQQRYKTIFPCSHRKTFDECFTTEEEMVFFWFNTEDETTHLITAQIT